MALISRRKHTKSRTGCLGCKRRHIKCDESRPVCGNCNITSRQCIFEQSLPSRTTGDACQNMSNTSSSLPQSEDESHADSVKSGFTDGEEDGLPINMLHMKLIHHFITDELSLFGYDKSIFETFDDSEIMESMLAAPYLMGQMLAFAALHLSVTTNETALAQYSNQLGSHAFKIFQSMDLKLDSQNCMPVFLFTSIRAFHMLSEKILFRGDNFGYFIGDLIDVFGSYQRLRAITNKSWPLILESSLKPLIEKEIARIDQGESGQECDEVLSLMRLACVDPSTRDIYLVAIGNLQKAIDGARNIKPELLTVGPVINWLVTIPPEFIDLLSERRPEALVVLAHFAALIHIHREIWAFRNGGIDVVNSIADFLGPAWSDWLLWPKKCILNIHAAER